MRQTAMGYKRLWTHKDIRDVVATHNQKRDSYKSNPVCQPNADGEFIFADPVRIFM